MALFLKASLLSVLTATALGANSALRAHSQQHISKESVEDLFFSEFVQNGKRSQRSAQLVQEFGAFFDALPKNEFGRLSSPVVRYALHRFFVQQRGWHVEGLNPRGDSWNTSSPSELMNDRVPAYIQELFERSLGGRGLDLDNLAAFAATIEDLVHKESTQLLQATFDSLGLDRDGPLSEEDVDIATKSYLLSTVLGSRVSNLTRKQLLKVQGRVHSAYPAWPNVVLWAEDLRKTLASTSKFPRSPFSSGINFEEMTHYVEEMGTHFGSFQDQECRMMKNLLVDKEYGNSGRVPLGSFYKDDGALGWQFSESPDYLRAIGALDESDAKSPFVLIPNYITSHSNCLASSSFYSVCCLNECESLMGQLERTIASPEAEPAQILDLVGRLPSESVSAPRELPKGLSDKLFDIADSHSGRVPLHGRLFAQWMHHAYPRECPYPHLTGSTNPMTPDQWMARGETVASTAEEKNKYVAAHESSLGWTNVSSSTDAWDDSDAQLKAMVELPWDSVEELVATHEVRSGLSFFSLRSLLRLLAQMAVVGASLFLIVSTARQSMGDLAARKICFGGSKESLPKYM